ncbi:hypothetical protein MKC73_04855 [[Clostridium] innocuum]|nr:hypothetical protein [[Clostridium] innocuum]MCR0263228.1 hypothetical protein [[Clostridium] innocuum]RJV90911.1 hypothetical protein DWX45_06985 [Erysipelotrichaceae bacterium AF19-24AC]
MIKMLTGWSEQSAKLEAGKTPKRNTAGNKKACLILKIRQTFFYNNEKCCQLLPQRKLCAEKAKNY